MSGDKNIKKNYYRHFFGELIMKIKCSYRQNFEREIKT